MRRYKWTCDRCGAETENQGDFIEVSVKLYGKGPVTEHYDFCPPCLQALKCIVNNQKGETRHE